MKSKFEHAVGTGRVFVAIADKRPLKVVVKAAADMLVRHDARDEEYQILGAAIQINYGRTAIDAIVEEARERGETVEPYVQKFLEGADNPLQFYS